ncbi:MAG: ATP-binding protein [Patescibacteria group bacterium]
MLKRAIEERIEKYLQGEDYKTFYIWGPRRSGKTTLLKQLSKKLGALIFNFDFSSDHQRFAPDRETLGKLVAENHIILIDEVQNYPQATVALKLLHDEFKVKVIATGSSELRQKGKEFDTQVGRFTQHYCLPLSIFEIKANTLLPAYEEKAFEKRLLETLQIFGSYPEVYTSEILSIDKKIGLLENIVDAYVLKDIIDIYELKNQKLARDILTKIALQLGSEISIREIANSLGTNGVTVANYVEIFIKNYILIALPSFKTNTRRAVSENRKLYFYDLGIRNALVKDFRETKLRPDQGGLFENFIILEIEKQRKNTQALFNLFFYREYGGKEVDIIVEDYMKNYTTVEIKTTEGSIKNIFPLPNNPLVITTQNYFEKISQIFEEPRFSQPGR